MDSTVQIMIYRTFTIDDEGIIWSIGDHKYFWKSNCIKHSPNVYQMNKSDLQMISITAVNNLFLIGIDKEGKVWGMGSNKGKQLGITKFPISPKHLKEFTIIPIPEPVISVVSRGNKTYFQTHDNVYGCGLVSGGNKPILIPNLKSIISIVCLRSSTYFLDSNGDIFIVGIFVDKNKSHLTFDTPTKYEYLSNIKNIYAICDEVLAINTDDELFVLYNREYDIPNSVELDATSPIQKISTSATHSVALESNGTLWLWYNGEDEFLFLYKEIYKITPVEKFMTIVAPPGIIWDFVATHSGIMAQTSEGIFTIGCDAHLNQSTQRFSVKEWTAIPEDKKKYFATHNSNFRNIKSARK